MSITKPRFNIQIKRHFPLGKESIMAQTNYKSAAELRKTIAARTAASEEGQLNAHARMKLLFDEGTFVEVGTYLCRKRTELDTEFSEDFEPVVTGYGAVDGTLVYAFSQDFTRLSGALGEMHAKKIVKITEMAQSSGAPLVGVFDSAGAKILEGVDALAGYGAIMSDIAGADHIPKIAVIAGPCGGSNAVIAQMFDVIIATENGSLYIAPSSALEDKTLGTPKKLAETGITSLTAKDDAEAFALVKKIISYLYSEMESGDDPSRAIDIDGILMNENYEVRDVIAQLVDGGSFFEMKAEYARHIVTGFATINSRPVAIVANDPAIKGGKLCPCTADKAADFIEFASARGIPVVTLVDSEGVAMSDKAEQKNISSKLARLVRAYYNSYTNVTVILGRAFGTAYTVMGSKGICRTAALALDRAQISPMSPERAVEFLGEVADESKMAQTAADWAEKYASPLEAAKSGHIDDIIEASELRARVAASLEMLLF